MQEGFKGSIPIPKPLSYNREAVSKVLEKIHGMEIDPAVFFDDDDQSFVFPNIEVVDDTTKALSVLRVPINNIDNALKQLQISGNSELVESVVTPEGFPADVVEAFHALDPNAEIVNGRIIFTYKGKTHSFSYKEAKKFYEKELIGKHPGGAEDRAGDTVIEWSDTKEESLGSGNVNDPHERGHARLLSLIQQKIDPQARRGEDGKPIVTLDGKEKKITWGEALAYLNDPEGFRKSMRDGVSDAHTPEVNAELVAHEVSQDGGPDTVPRPIEYNPNTISDVGLRNILTEIESDSLQARVERDAVWPEKLIRIAKIIYPNAEISPDRTRMLFETKTGKTWYTLKTFKEFLARERPYMKTLLDIIEKGNLEHEFEYFDVSREQLQGIPGFEALDVADKRLILNTLHTLLRETALLKAKEESSRNEQGAETAEKHNEEILARAKEIEKSAQFERVEEFIGSLVVHLGDPNAKRLLLEGNRLNGLARSFGSYMLTQSEAATTLPDSLQELPEKNVSNPTAQAVQREMTVPVRPKSGTKEANRERPSAPFIEAYTKEFGIHREDLESIEGYERLSKDQRELLFENFKSLTLGSVPEEAVRMYEQSRKAGREEKVHKYGKLCGNAFAALREAFTKESTVALSEKDAVKRIRTGGFLMHKHTLEQLVGSLANYGPKAHKNPETGELFIDFLNLHERAPGHPSAEWKAMEYFNVKAHAFARTPEAWRGRTIGVDDSSQLRVTLWFKKNFSTKYKNQKKFAEAEGEYLRARQHLEKTLSEQGKSEQEIALLLMGADARVSQQQMLHTAPEALEALAAIEDTSLWKQVAKRVVTNGNLGYMGLGFVGRTLAGAAVGVLGAPIAAAGIASVRSWNKTAAELRERDRLAREGIKDTKEGALNVVSAVDIVTLRTGNRETRVDRGLTQRMIDRIQEYRTFVESGSNDEKQREKILMRLRGLAEYINDRQREGRINYGSREERVAHQTRLCAVLGEALAIIADVDAPKNKRLEEKLTRKLTRSEARIRGVRQKYRTTELRWSVLKAAGFSIGGALLAHAFQDLEMAKKIRSVFGGDDARIPGKNPSLKSAGAPHEETSGIQERESRGVQKEEVVPTQMPQLGKHLVQEGDTLMKILREQIPEIAELGSAQEKDTKILNLLRTLNQDELRDIGVTSKDPNLIRVGERIDLEKVSELLTKKV